jgi:hypothetical protein
MVVVEMGGGVVEILVVGPIYLVFGGEVWRHGYLEGCCSGVNEGEVDCVYWVLRGEEEVVGCPEARWF